MSLLRLSLWLLRTIIIPKQVLLLVASALTALLLPFTAAANDRYVVTVSPDLTRLEVQVRFTTPTTAIAARGRRAAQYLLSAHDCDSDAPLSAQGRRMRLPDDGLQCLNYVVDLEKAAQAEQRNDTLHPGNVVVSPINWMWRPRLTRNRAIPVEFRLPDNTRVSVPWPAEKSGKNRFLLSASPQSGTAIAAFGNFRSFNLQVGAIELPVIVLRSRTEFDAAPIVDWVRDNALNITRAYGRFPNPDARVLVFPQQNRRRDSAVQFGRVVRDGGETVELLVDPLQPIESFYDSWTATHEFSHLMLPYVDSGQRWISEGFAQYYQNLLLARSGQYTQQYAWQKLHDGLQRGRESAPTLSPNAAASADERNTRMKIYWSGAALALMADTELRRRSDGRESLDDVLGRLQACCLPSTHSWSGRELFARLDTFVDEPLFVRLYEQYANEPGFPDTGPLLRRLGVTLDGSVVKLDDDAELAEIRAALTAQRYTGESRNGGND